MRLGQEITKDVQKTLEQFRQERQRQARERQEMVDRMLASASARERMARLRVVGDHTTR